MTNASTLEATREFWNASPCDGQDTFAVREQFRYAKDPWLPPLLREVANNYTDVLEVGCGQGTDALTLCSLLSNGAQYVGVDYSSESVASARASAESVRDQLRVTPDFREGNAEALTIDSDSVACVYSCGVLHHTPNTQGAIDEIFRVLQPGGVAYVMLYRTYSPRLLVAHLIRGCQRVVDQVTGGDRTLYRRLSGNFLEAKIGTAIQECLGVPILRSYTAGGMRRLFRKFEILDLTPVGPALPPFGGTKAPIEQDRVQPTATGVYYLIKGRKPGA